MCKWVANSYGFIELKSGMLFCGNKVLGASQYLFLLSSLLREMWNEMELVLQLLR